MWAFGHSTRHTGEDYNLSCALRQGAGQGLTSWIFYLPLALAGFPMQAFAAYLNVTHCINSGFIPN